MRVPTRQLEVHADERKYKPATRRFIPSVYRQSPGYYEPFTIDLHLINQEIAKTRGKPFVRGVLNYVREEILGSPAIKVLHKHSPYTFKIKIIPFSDLKENDKTKKVLTAEDVVEKRETPYNEKNTELQAEDKGIDHQQLIYSERKTKSAGIVFQKRDLWKIAKYPKELIDQAINCFKAAELSQTTHIRNPAGWLIRCLQNKYYLSYRFEKVAASLEEKLFAIQDYFLENLGTLPTRMDRLL